MGAADRPAPGVAFAPAGGDEGRLAELRARAVAAGVGALSAEEALELFLARAAGRAAAGFARRLLARFGSLPEALGAPCETLRQVVPPKVAVEIALLHDLNRRALAEPLRRRPLLASTSAVAAYLRVSLAALPREEFHVLFLDRRNGLILDETMGRGTVDHAPVYPREVVRRALEVDASALILAHNHPGRDCTPSAADVDITRQVADACRALRIALHDHLVVGGDEVASFRALGLL